MTNKNFKPYNKVQHQSVIHSVSLMYVELENESTFSFLACSHQSNEIFDWHYNHNSLYTFFSPQSIWHHTNFLTSPHQSYLIKFKYFSRLSNTIDISVACVVGTSVNLLANYILFYFCNLIVFPMIETTQYSLFSTPHV